MEWVLAFLIYIHAQQGRPLDPAVFAGVPLLLLLVAGAASWIPARLTPRGCGPAPTRRRRV